jgi:hypothetical protein
LSGSPQSLHCSATAVTTMSGSLQSLHTPHRVSKQMPAATAAHCPARRSLYIVRPTAVTTMSGSLQSLHTPRRVSKQMPAATAAHCPARRSLYIVRPLPSPQCPARCSLYIHPAGCLNKCQLPPQHIVRLAAVSTLFGHHRHQPRRHHNDTAATSPTSCPTPQSQSTSLKVFNPSTSTT